MCKICSLLCYFCCYFGWIFYFNWKLLLPTLFSSVVVVQWLSHVWLFATSCTAACPASLSFTMSWSLLRFMSTESMMLFNHLILYRPLLLLPSIFPSIRQKSPVFPALQAYFTPKPSGKSLEWKDHESFLAERYFWGREVGKTLFFFLFSFKKKFFFLVVVFVS